MMPDAAAGIETLRLSYIELREQVYAQTFHAALLPVWSMEYPSRMPRLYTS